MSQAGKESGSDRTVLLSAIMSEYEGPLLRYAIRIVHQHDAAQTVVQDAFIRLFKSWHDELTPSPKLLNWLYCVAHNCAVDYLRKENRLRLLHLRHAEEQDPAEKRSAGLDAGMSEKAEQASLALQRLSLREQQLIILKVYEEKSYAEISEITGLTVSNVGYILHFAMKKLAEHLKGPQSA